MTKEKTNKSEDSIDQSLQDLGIKSDKPEINTTVVNHKLSTADYDYFITCKEQLVILIASGKCKEFIGKSFTYQDIDNMTHSEIIKYYKIYETARSARINDALSETIIKGYSKMCSYVIPIKDENKLYNDLKSDYILMTEMNKWVGYFSLQLGGVMTLVSTGVITFSNLKTKDECKLTEITDISNISDSNSDNSTKINE